MARPVGPYKPRLKVHADVPTRRLGTPTQIIRHRPGAPGLRLGFGPGLRPRRALEQLQALFADNTFWAAGRSRANLARMLRGSEAVVSAWKRDELVGFGRATSDGQYRAVLWDVVVSKEQQGQGLGRLIVEALLASPPVAAAERIYLMTTKGEGFYERLGFSRVDCQRLMAMQRPSEQSRAGDSQDDRSPDAAETGSMPASVDTRKKRGED